MNNKEKEKTESYKHFPHGKLVLIDVYFHYEISCLGNQDFRESQDTVVVMVVPWQYNNIAHWVTEKHQELEQIPGHQILKLPWLLLVIVIPWGKRYMVYLLFRVTYGSFTCHDLSTSPCSDIFPSFLSHSLSLSLT